LTKVYGVILTDPFADTAFLVFEVNAAFINIGHKGNGLSVVYVDGFVVRYFLVKPVRVFDRTVLYTGGTTRTFVLINVSGLLGQSNLEIPCMPFDFIDFSEA
jgi:hypothetical protein